eukprot:11124705-Lingulodinium_polyedra.AAC.1
MRRVQHLYICERGCRREGCMCRGKCERNTEQGCVRQWPIRVELALSCEYASMHVREVDTNDCVRGDSANMWNESSAYLKMGA